MSNNIDVFRFKCEERAESRTTSFLKRHFCKIYNGVKAKNSIYIKSSEVKEIAESFYLQQFLEHLNPKDSEVRSYVLQTLISNHSDVKSNTTSSRFIRFQLIGNKVPKRRCW